MKFLTVFIALAMLSISTTYAATLTAKMKQNTEWGEESAQLTTSKGHIVIYAVGLTKNQVNQLAALKKGNCVQIKAKGKNFEKYDGVITIMDFESAKKVQCK